MENQLAYMDILVFGAVVVAMVVIFLASLSGRRKTGERSDGVQGAQQLQTATVHYVIDGDTVVVAIGWKKRTLRLDSIDCPEKGQDWGDTAKYGLIKLIGGRRIHFEEHAQDQYGRTVATIYVGKRGVSAPINVNARMVTLGHAWVLRRLYGHLPKHRQDELNRMEKWARTKKVGLWKDPNPVPPWRWRKNANQA